MKKLKHSTVQLITSSQVITSIFTIVKELVENSLDAGALKVDVKLLEYGLEGIEVSDNGTGIGKNDISVTCLPHHTSKISSFDDLQSLTTYGFRGEALHSLCSLASVAITTKTKDDSIAISYRFLENGSLDEQNSKPSAGCDGTIVVVTDLFKNIPVRKQYYKSEKKLKEDLKKIELLLMAYSIAYPHVRFSIVNNKKNIFLKNSFKSIKDVLRQIWGPTCINLMQNTCENEPEIKIKIETFLPVFTSNPLEKCFNSEKSFIIVNNRPVVMQEIDRAIKDKIRSLGFNQRICYCVIITISSSQLDVNLEPNKLKILLHQKEQVLNILDKIFWKVYSVSEENIGNNNNSNEERQLRNTPKDTCTAKKANFAIETLSESVAKSTEVRDNIKNMETHFQKQLQKHQSKEKISKTKIQNESIRSQQSSNNNNSGVSMQNNSEESILDEDLVFESNWKRGNLRTNSNELLQPVKMLVPRNKRSLSPLKKSNEGKKKCLSLEKTSSYSISKNMVMKQGSSAYTMFARDVRKQVINENPTSDYMEIDRIILHGWETLDAEKRRKYEEVCSRNKIKKLNIQNSLLMNSDRFGKFVKTNTEKRRQDVRVVEIKFDLEKLKRTKANNLSIKPSYNLIGKLKDGPWLLNFGNCIGTWNQCRGKEIEVYNNLLENHQLSPKSLELSLPLTEGLVGGQAQWLKLLSLQGEQDIGVYFYISDSRIVSNGIKVRKWQDLITNYVHAEITHLTDVVSFYGVADLKEILNKISADDEITLAQSRPRQIVNYYKSEAIRLSRQIPIGMNKEQVEVSIDHALKLNPRLTECECIHGLPVFSPFYDFSMNQTDMAMTEG